MHEIGEEIHGRPVPRMRTDGRPIISQVWERHFSVAISRLIHRFSDLTRAIKKEISCLWIARPCERKKIGSMKELRHV